MDCPNCKKPIKPFVILRDDHGVVGRFHLCYHCGFAATSEHIDRITLAPKPDPVEEAIDFQETDMLARELPSVVFKDNAEYMMHKSKVSTANSRVKSAFGNLRAVYRAEKAKWKKE